MKSLLVKYARAGLLLLTALLVGCVYDGIDAFDDYEGGSRDVVFRFAYNAFSVDGATTRTDGRAITDINDLTILLYDGTTGKLAKKYNARPGGGSGYYNLTTSTSTQSPVVTDPSTKLDNDVIKRAEVTIEAVPFGYYYAFAVANMNCLADYNEEEYEDIQDFRKLKFGWNPDVTKVNKNNQMSGYFSTTAAVSPATVDAYQMQRIEISNATKNVQPHCWLLRAASKVTMAFDGSNLNKNVRIYIQSVQIKDIPTSCLLIDHNTPDPDNEDPAYPNRDGLTDGEMLKYYSGDTPGKTSGIAIAKGYPYAGTKGHVDYLKDPDTKAWHPDVHCIDEQSLFFYENMQGIHRDENGNGIKHIYRPELDDDGKLKLLKDSVPHGTFIEVHGYYYNDEPGYQNQGHIVYRYMLGMNSVDDFNAQRNTHYKVTMRFNKDANDPDWHIEYRLPMPPEVGFPDDLYISYLYNSKLNVPITLFVDPSMTEYQDVKIIGISARITSNPYTHDQHPYKTSMWDGNARSQSGSSSTATDYVLPTLAQDSLLRHTFGFLTFKDESSRDVRDNEEFYTDYIHSREYLCTGATQQYNYTGHQFIKNSSTDAQFQTDTQHTFNEETQTHIYNMPIWTRSLNIWTTHPTLADDHALKYKYESGLSGNNSYAARERVGKIHVVVQLNRPIPVDGSAEPQSVIEHDINIHQVHRLVNPKACWWRWNERNEFLFTMMETNDFTKVSEHLNPTYTPIRSIGTWAVHFYEYADGIDDWIEIRSAKPGSTWQSGRDALIEGSMLDKVEFYARPKSTLASANATPRFSCFEVTYNNNNCRHLIFVCQGMKELDNFGGNTWKMSNVIYANNTGIYEADSPLDEGSMFKYGNLATAIKSVNSEDSRKWEGVSTWPIGQTKGVPFETYNYVYKNNKGTIVNTFNADGTAYFEDIPSAKPASESFDTSTLNAGIPMTGANSDGYMVATAAAYEALTDPALFGNYFGVILPASMGRTPTTVVDRYYQGGYAGSSSSSSRLNSGMQAFIVYERATKRFLTFPLGSAGVGRRKLIEDYKYTGDAAPTTLTNANSKFGVLSYASRAKEMRPEDFSDRVYYRPMLFDICERPGALYWLNEHKPQEGTTTNLNIQAFDINYFTFKVALFDSALAYESTSSYTWPVPSLIVRQRKIGNTNTMTYPNSNAIFVRRIKRQ